MAEASVKMDDSYKKESKMQQTATNRAIETAIITNRVTKYIKENEDKFGNSDCFRIAEFGCADGSNSLAILRHIIKAVRSHDNTKTIEILCNDLPTANFSSLFENLNPLKEEFGSIFISSCGASFCDQIFPNNSIDFAFSFTSVHWLQKTPGPLDALFRTSAGMDNLDQQQVQVWVDYADEEWTNFVRSRENELKPGAVLYVSTLSYKENSTEGEKVMPKMYQKWIKGFGNILEEYNCGEYKYDLNLPMVFRSPSEFKRPFDGSSAVNMCLESYSDFTLEVNAFLEAADEGNYQKLLKLLEGRDRAVTKPYYRSKLDKISSLNDAQREEILEKMYASMYSEFEPDINPGNVFTKFTYCEMLISKLNKE